MAGLADSLLAGSTDGVRTCVTDGCLVGVADSMLACVTDGILAGNLSIDASTSLIMVSEYRINRPRESFACGMVACHHSFATFSFASYALDFLSCCKIRKDSILSILGAHQNESRSRNMSCWGGTKFSCRLNPRRDHKTAQDICAGIYKVD